MFERAPNGFFTQDLIVFNHLRRGGYVSKGFVFEAPDLTNSPIADLNDFQSFDCFHGSFGRQMMSPETSSQNTFAKS